MPLPEALEAIAAGSRAILLCGISGSGKTTLARMLEERGFDRVSADAMIWQRYGDDFPKLPPETKQRAFSEMDAMIAAEIERRLGRGQRIVVDATLCKRAKRDILREACRRRDVEPTLVFLQAEQPVLASRLAARRGSGPDDQIVPPEALGMYCKGFQKPDDDENAVVISQF